jgi:lipopolysaccharide/colanic/teichoic acid biosynthesis glycosyltransferase
MTTKLLEPLQQPAYLKVESSMYEQGIVVMDITSPEYTWISLLEHMQDHHIRRLAYYIVFKRCCDVVVATICLIFAIPVFILVALAIWLESPGAPVFRQTRIGKNGRPFMMYKFSTMIPDRRNTKLLFEGEDRRKHHKTQNDPRVTRLGKVLRQTSIDELPQLWNIIRGDMSLIGPRPELSEIVDHYEPWQHRRHLVRPGLTGWWQIHGRSDLPMHEHTELDIYYVTNISFWLDMRILLRTIRIVLLRSGAF